MFKIGVSGYKLRMRFITLDTETTGFNKKRGDSVCKGHRVIEIACVEIIDGKITGKYFHTFCKPDRDIDPEAIKVHGITDDSIKNAPLFGDIVEKLLRFLSDSIIVIHNAKFDIAFIDKELLKLPNSLKPIRTFVFIDTLELARGRFPFSKNDLDSLCCRAKFDGRLSKKHGALLDAHLLAKVFLFFFS